MTIPRGRANGEWRAFVESAALATTNDCVIPSGWNSRPNFRLNERYMNASRAVWMIAHGDPGEAHVLHTCHRGNEGCINIQHLYLGDRHRNMRDMAEAGRGVPAERRARGERAAKAKLTADDVRKIRRRYVWTRGKKSPNSQTALAAEFGVSQRAISHIVRGKSWAHVK